MKLVAVRYQIKADRIAENTRLVEALFAELRAKQPAGLKYASFMLDDRTILHIAAMEDGAMSVSDLDAFEAYHENLSDRLEVKPIPCDAELIGNYGLLAEAVAAAAYTP
jgi:hypothetical protein